MQKDSSPKTSRFRWLENALSAALDSFEASRDSYVDSFPTEVQMARRIYLWGKPVTRDAELASSAYVRARDLLIERGLIPAADVNDVSLECET